MTGVCTAKGPRAVVPGPGYQLAAPDGIGAGNLILAEAAAAALAGLFVLIRGS